MQQIKQNLGLFGRIGKNVGESLAEQIPRETERNRLSSGLKKLGEQQGLSPFQRFSELAAIPGVTPQMLQSGSELLNREAQRQNVRNRAGGNQPQNIPEQAEAMPGMQTNGQSSQNINVNNIVPNSISRGGGEANKFGEPQIAPNNPLRESAQPKKPWTPQHLDDRTAFYMDDGVTTFPEARQLAKEDEARDLAGPSIEEERDTKLRATQQRVEDEFTKQLERKLQKNNEGVFQNVTGEHISNAIRAMERDLRLNPNASEKDVADKWSTKLLEFSKAKTQMEAMNPSIFRKEQTMTQLNGYQKIFKETGNLDEFYNKLQHEKKLGLSPYNAASIAYPRSDKISSYIKDAKPVSKNSGENSRKFAIDVEDRITGNDSILAIAKDLAAKYPFFDYSSFFNQLNEDQENLGLNPRQKREIAEGPKDIFPTWGDIWIMPIKGPRPIISGASLTR